MPEIYKVSNSKWDETFSSEVQKEALKMFEQGNLITFPNLAFELTEDEQAFLSTECENPKSKNIFYNRFADRIDTALEGKDKQRLADMIIRFGDHATKLVHALFPDYVDQIEQDMLTYRPLPVEGHDASKNKRDMLLHVDAFSKRPSQGKRIIRFFSNIHPGDMTRDWRLGEPFEDVANTFLPDVTVPILPNSKNLKTRGKLNRKFSLYDHVMLQIHDMMKANPEYQKNCKQMIVKLPPRTSWMVMTDTVPHAVMAGQFCLEQTFFLPVEAMVAPEHSPLKILERLTKMDLIKGRKKTSSHKHNRAAPIGALKRWFKKAI